MKFILIVLLLLPSIVSGGDYQRIANGMRVVEIKEGKITVTERTPRFKKLYYFISSHPSEKNPIQTTELIHSCPYPEIMASIASVESGFKPTAVGKDGEVSIFQILKWQKGNPINNQDALKEALRVFEEKRLDHKSISASIKAYNGKGLKAEKYKLAVLKRVDQIKSMKI